MHRKPVLFLDFDRTLFDTEQFYAWLGDDRFERTLALVAGKITPPDWSTFLYDDTLSFLKAARRTHRLVILTFSVNLTLQRRKVSGSGVSALVDDVIISSHDKGSEAKAYLARIKSAGGQHVFVDDAPENISDMKRVNPRIRTVRIARIPLLPEERGTSAEADLVVSSLIELLPHLSAQ